MKRFYSHYTFIFPDIYLKNVIVELDNENHIKAVYPFRKEIEKTKFYSGWLFFVPREIELSNDIIRNLNKLECKLSDDYSSSSSQTYTVFDGDGGLIVL